MCGFYYVKWNLHLFRPASTTNALVVTANNTYSKISALAVPNYCFDTPR